ncbi:hypothetical protein ZWY2020_046669 [Hordeum vulgare]|nr:hypothetical protein ZWY2020_046669 [Hordeum vulgare]
MSTSRFPSRHPSEARRHHQFTITFLYVVPSLYALLAFASAARTSTAIGSLMDFYSDDDPHPEFEEGLREDLKLVHFPCIITSATSTLLSHMSPPTSLPVGNFGFLSFFSNVRRMVKHVILVLASLITCHV